MSGPIVLVGPRGSGKSTLGRRLAAHLGWEFVDADALLEERSGRRIPEWLAADAAGFRAAESALVPELLERRRAVVALGGGVVESLESRARLAAHEDVWALRAPVEDLVARQRAQPRPPLMALSLEEEVARLWDRRRAAYGVAASGRWVDTSGSVDEAWERLRRAVLGC